jgi:hypothetical protein
LLVIRKNPGDKDSFFHTDIKHQQHIKEVW